MSTPLKGGAMLPPTAEELKGKSMDYKAVMAAISTGNEQAARKLLQQCNDAYYGNGTSSLTDAEFDAAQKAYTAKFGLPLKTAPTVKPAAKGRTDRHAGVAHDWPFLSGWLAKAAGKEELLDWYAKRRASANVSATQVGSPKWDGMSVVLTYDRHGNVQRALTRGDDGRGVDVTRLFAGECHFRDYDAEVRFGVKYEIVMTWSALDKLNSELDLELKNPRNTVAGIVASDESASRRKYITLVPLDIEWDDCEASRIERLEMMQSLFCPLLDENDNVAAPAVFTGNGDRDTPFFFWTAETDEEIQAIYDEVYSWRDQDDFEYMIDGVVFEFAALEDIELLGGRQCDCPDYAIAAKFPSMTGRTKVVSIDFDLGNTGRLTPVVNYEPITMDGRTFSRTSISNFVRFDALKLCVGTPIIVEIRGDVLGWIDRDGEDPKGATPIEFVPPEGCHFTHNKQGQRVFAVVDAPLDGRCERMMVKCGVKGVRIETIAKLVQAGVVTCLADMWTVSDRYDHIVAIPGLGESSADILCSAIDGKLKGRLWDWEILASVGITGVGRTLSKEALKVWSLDEMVGSVTIPDTPAVPSANALSAALVPAIGPERTRMLIDGITAKVDDLRALMALGEFKSIKAAQASIGDGQKFKVVVTGDLNHWERDEFKNYIESLGHKMVGSVSSKTDLLITNTPNSGTVKNKRAAELGVRIVTELEAVEVMGLTLPGGGTSSQPVAHVPGETVDLDDM